MLKKIILLKIDVYFVIVNDQKKTIKNIQTKKINKKFVSKIEFSIVYFENFEKDLN